MADSFELARQIAETEDVSTPVDSVVLYSTSYLPSDENKRAALKYVAEHEGSCMLDHTICGKKLITLNVETKNNQPDENLLEIWAIASKRFIMAASGNVTAFVKGADKRSIFVSVELPLILQNDKIKQINGMDKHEFSKKFL